MIEVSVVRPAEVSPERIEELASFLLPEEKERQARFVSAELRREYLVTRVLARWSLSVFVPGVRPEAWTFARTESHRPFVTSRDGLDFNLSNTPWLVACAVSTGRVGLDVELLARGDDVLEVASWCFSDEELDGLFALPIVERRVRAVELWTLKESYVKALGDGISAPLRAITFRPSDPTSGAETSLWHVVGQDPWVFELRHLHGHAVAVAGKDGHEIVFRETSLRP